jgi:hypothetical protein
LNRLFLLIKSNDNVCILVIQNQNFFTMKKIARILFLSGVIFLFTALAATAQDIVVRKAMRPPVSMLGTRPVAPSRKHVWIGEEWAPRGTSYTWKGGYWALPPHPHATWVTGHWRHVRRGYVWVPGHWR